MQTTHEVKLKRGLVLAGIAFALVSPCPAAEVNSDEVEAFATVGETVVTAEEYRLALREGMRKRFYHGTVPAETLAAFQREVGEELVTETLLMQEAERRKITADQDWVQINPTAGTSNGEVDPIDVSIDTTGLGGGVHMSTISVTGDGQPVNGASVSAEINRDGTLYTTGSGTTGPDGSVDLKVNNAPSGCYDTVVTAAGLSWDGSYPDNSFEKGGAVC